MISISERMKYVRSSLRQSDYRISKIVNKLRTAAIFVYIYVRVFFRWKNLFATILNSFFSFINGSLVRCKCSMRWRSALMIKKLSLLKHRTIWNIFLVEIFCINIFLAWSFGKYLYKKTKLSKYIPYCTLYRAVTIT